MCIKWPKDAATKKYLLTLAYSLYAIFSLTTLSDLIALIMKFFTAAITFALAATAVFAAPSDSTAVTVSYDQNYDNAAASLDTVACSDGPNGMEHLGEFMFNCSPRKTPTKLLYVVGFTTFGSLPTKYIGGAAVIAGWGSAECGTCWQLTYEGTSINVLAIDHANSGFNIALSAMNALTNGQAVFLGRVEAMATQVDKSACGL